MAYLFFIYGTQWQNTHVIIPGLLSRVQTVTVCSEMKEVNGKLVYTGLEGGTQHYFETLGCSGILVWVDGNKAFVDSMNFTYIKVRGMNLHCVGLETWEEEPLFDNLRSIAQAKYLELLGLWLNEDTGPTRPSGLDHLQLLDEDPFWRPPERSGDDYMNEDSN